MSEWQPYPENKPEQYDFVLVFQQSNGTGEPSPMSLARHNGKEWEMLAEDAGCYQDLYWDIDVSRITHWMPLPHPPKKVHNIQRIQK